MSNSGNDHGSGRGMINPEDREALKRRAAGIGARLEQVKARQAPQQLDSSARGAALGQAFRITIELVVGVLFGGLIGWWLDGYLGTRPWLLVLFLILGFAAGMTNVIRTARRMQAAAEPLQRTAPSVVDDENDR